MAVGQPVIAVFDGDPVVREALEALLQAAGYHIRSLHEPTGDECDELLADVHLLLVAPQIDAERRKALFLDKRLSLTVLGKVPILELVPEGGERSVHFGRFVLWPCSVEQLKRAIDAAVSTEE